LFVLFLSCFFEGLLIVDVNKLILKNERNDDDKRSIAVEHQQLEVLQTQQHQQQQQQALVGNTNI